LQIYNDVGKKNRAPQDAIDAKRSRSKAAAAAALMRRSPRSLRGRSTAAATRDQPVHFGIVAGAQGTHPGLVGATKLSSVVARFASRPSAAQAPSA
jgi:hypothetical protein